MKSAALSTGLQLQHSLSSPSKGFRQPPWGHPLLKDSPLTLTWAQFLADLNFIGNQLLQNGPGGTEEQRQAMRVSVEELGVKAGFEEQLVEGEEEEVEEVEEVGVEQVEGHDHDHAKMNQNKRNHDGDYNQDDEDHHGHGDDDDADDADDGGLDQEPSKGGDAEEEDTSPSEPESKSEATAAAVTAATATSNVNAAGNAASQRPKERSTVKLMVKKSKVKFAKIWGARSLSAATTTTDAQGLGMDKLKLEEQPLLENEVHSLRAALVFEEKPAVVYCLMVRVVKHVMMSAATASLELLNDLAELLMDLVALLILKLDSTPEEGRTAFLSLYLLAGLMLGVPRIKSTEIFQKEIPPALLLSLPRLSDKAAAIVFFVFEKVILATPESRETGLQVLRVASLAWKEKRFGEGQWARSASGRAFFAYLTAGGELSKLEEAVSSASTDVRFKALVDRLCVGTKSLWRVLPCTLPEDILRSYTEKEQLESLDRCRRLRKKAAAIESELLKLAKEDPAEEARQREVLKEYNREISARMLGVDLKFFGEMATVNMFAATQEYMRRSEEYDPEITNDNLVQAARNVWTCYALQLICLQEDACLNNGILGYSLLYPYTDNYLDDAKVDKKAKYQFQKTFGAWLEGDYTVPPATKVEKKVFDQVKFVESKYPRDQFPNAFHSLTAINDAQTASLAQHAELSMSEVLGITVYKGGTSVLADLFMGDGAADDERDLIFSFILGVGLQLVDDLQDVVEDGAVGHHTVFTRMQDGKQFCDLLVLRLMRLLDWVAHPRHEWGLKVRTPNALLLRRQMLLMCNSIVMKSIAQSAQMFSAEFIEQYKRYAPVPLVTLKNEKSMKHLLGLVHKNAI